MLSPHSTFAHVLLLFLLTINTVFGISPCSPSLKSAFNPTAHCGRRHRLLDAADISTLQFAQVVFRHGDRSPLEFYPNDPYQHPMYWPQGEGQLSTNGKEMGYDLGKYIRWRYDHFLSNLYQPGEVHVKSSDFDRTIMTALTCLAGLFPVSYGTENEWNPDVNWQPIPVHTLPVSSDCKIAYFVDHCPRYKELMYEIGNSTFLKNLNAEYQNLFDYLQVHTGTSNVDIKYMGSLFDTLHVEEISGLKLPDWTKSVYPDKMHEPYLWPFRLLTFTPQLRKLRGGPLLAEMIHHMDLTILSKATADPNPEVYKKNQKMLKQFKKAKIHMYSGHDTTITALLASIGVFDFTHVPPYTSMTMLELHKDDTHGYFVRLFYRNETNGKHPIEYSIPHCIENCNDINQVCTYTKFKELMQSTLPTNWKEDCKATGVPTLTLASNAELIASVTPCCNDISEVYGAAISSSQFDTVVSTGAGVGEELYGVFIQPFVNFYFWIVNLF